MGGQAFAQCGFSSASQPHQSDPPGGRAAERRAEAWRAAAEANGGMHPDVTPVKDRVLTRMRATALPALQGGGMASR